MRARRRANALRARAALAAARPRIARADIALIRKPTVRARAATAWSAPRATPPGNAKKAPAAFRLMASWGLVPAVRRTIRAGAMQNVSQEARAWTSPPTDQGTAITLPAPQRVHARRVFASIRGGGGFARRAPWARRVPPARTAKPA